MREIKFRRAHYNENGFSHFTYWGKIDHKVKTSDSAFTSPCHVSDCIKSVDEQYTGLKDNNGTEIFEGDTTQEGEVIYSSEYLGFFVKGDDTEDGLEPLYDIPLVEIIGNIHEKQQ